MNYDDKFAIINFFWINEPESAHYKVIAVVKN